jgi:tetratricopeptide (TPR) repeat protein
MSFDPVSPDPETWGRVSRLLDEVLDLPAAERPAFLAGRCGHDADLRQRVEQLLQADAASGDFLEHGPVITATVLRDLAREDEWAGGAPERATVTTPDAASSMGPEEPAGRRIGPWRLVREIGRGGMGVVYLAERADGQFEQRAALKLLKRGLDTEEILGRFLRERQILARLQHPGIARLLDGGMSDDLRPYFAMEYVEGRPIVAECEARHLPLAERLRLMERVCDAVQYAHANLVVHRDLKPSNVLLTAAGTVTLLDFGIARLLSGPGEPSATLTRGPALMTPQYASPEQVRGEPASTATDVYALGLILYELVAGRRPYDVHGIDGATSGRVILDTAPRPPSKVAVTPRMPRALAPDLDALVLTALRKEPERRYPTAQALGEDLERLRRGLPIRAQRDTLGYRLRKFASRHRAGVAAALLAGAGLLAGLGGTLWQARIARQEARRAGAVKDFLLGLFAVSDPSQAQGQEITARELLDRGAARIDAGLDDAPDLRVEMLGVLGDIYEHLGLYDRARPLVDRGLELSRTAFGPGDTRVGAALRRQGTLLTDTGRPAEAIPLLRQALSLHLSLHGPASAEVARDQEELAAALLPAGRTEEAARLVAQVLETQRRLHPGDHVEVATALNNAGLMARQAGRFDEAAGLDRESIGMRRRLLGPDDPDLCSPLINLASVLRQQGRIADAEEPAREALRIARKSLGDAHATTITAMNTLAVMDQSLAHYGEAAALHREVLAHWEKTRGRDHPSALVSINNLASVLKDQGDEAAAVPLFREAIEKFPKAVGPKHPFNAVAMTHLGGILRDQGRYDEAEDLLRRATALLEELRGPDHPETAVAAVQLGTLLQARGRNEEADALLRRSLEARERGLGADNPATQASRLALAGYLRDRGALDEAADLDRRALAGFRSSAPPGHPDIALAALELGRTDTARGRSGEAVPLLREALADRVAVFGEASWKTAEARLALAAALAAKDDSTAAAPGEEPLVESRRLVAEAIPVLRRVREPTSRLGREAQRVTELVAAAGSR